MRLQISLKDGIQTHALLTPDETSARKVVVQEEVKVVIIASILLVIVRWNLH